MYKLVKDKGIDLPIVERIADNAYIPFDPDNTDYQAYLKWVAEGNTPDPAENT